MQIFIFTEHCNFNLRKNSNDNVELGIDKSFLKEFNTNLVRDKVMGGRTQKYKIPAFPRTSISQIMLALASRRVRFFKKS